MGKHVDDIDRKKCQHIPNMGTWFAWKDVAAALGYKDTVNAIKQHVDETDKKIFKGGKTPCLNISNRGVTIINESGMYALIFGSKLERAKAFKQRHGISVSD